MTHETLNSEKYERELALSLIDDYIKGESTAEEIINILIEKNDPALKEALQEEIQYHLDYQPEENMDQSMSIDDARREEESVEQEREKLRTLSEKLNRIII